MTGIDRLLYSGERNKRDCDTLILSTGQNFTDDTELCICDVEGLASSGVDLTRFALTATTCLSQPDTTFFQTQLAIPQVPPHAEHSQCLFPISPLIEIESFVVNLIVGDLTMSQFFLHLSAEKVQHHPKSTRIAVLRRVLLVFYE